MEGTKFCVGNCQGKSHQGSTNLQVYSLPDTLQLETQPKELVAGQPAHLHCSISKVYPPGSLTLSWYRGDQRLESPDAEEVADDEELFSYDSELEVPGEKVTEGMEFRCEVELLLPPSDRSFHRATAVTVSTKAVAEQPTTESVTGQENPRTESPATTRNPPATDRSPTTGLGATTGNPPATDRSPTTGLGATTGNPPATDRSPTTGLGATTGNPPATDRSPTTGLGATTGNPATELTSAESPTTEFIVTSHKPSAKATSVHWLVTTETLATESRAASQHPSAGAATTDWSPSTASSSATENPTTGDVASTENPLTKKATSDRSRRTESVCNLQIRPVPPKGTTGEALKIICEAECGENVTIRWLKTPVVLSHYQEEASEGKSTLTVDRVGLDHQGIYECFMLSRRLQVARLHIAVSADIFSTDSAILVGTASSLLGLIVTAFASRRLWRRLHPPGVKSSKGNSV
ncbi:mucosal addressin cell adhesion molecule 1 isoform X3 [Chrysemys picta bellii]